MNNHCFIKATEVNAWQFFEKDILTYPFTVEKFYVKDNTQYWLCFLSSGDVIVKEEDYIIELPIIGSEIQRVLFSVDKESYNWNFYEMTKEDIEYLEKMQWYADSETDY